MKNINKRRLLLFLFAATITFLSGCAMRSEQDIAEDGPDVSGNMSSRANYSYETDFGCATDHTAEDRLTEILVAYDYIEAAVVGYDDETGLLSIDLTLTLGDTLSAEQEESVETMAKAVFHTYCDIKVKISVG